MAPTLGTWKGPERFWLCLIKGGQSLAAALFLGRTQLLESSLLQFLLQVAFLEKEIYPGRVSRDNFLKASKKSGKLNIWGYLATKKWNIVSTEIKLLGFWRMPESFGRKIPMKKQPLLVTKIISSSPGEINSLTFPSQAGILHAPSFSNSNFFFLQRRAAGQRPHSKWGGRQAERSTLNKGWWKSMFEQVGLHRSDTITIDANGVNEKHLWFRSTDGAKSLWSC